MGKKCKKVVCEAGEKWAVPFADFFSLLLALFIALALLSGEAWGLLSTAERIIAARETAAEPARKLGEARRAAEGIPVTDNVLADLTKVAEDRGIAPLSGAA